MSDSSGVASWTENSKVFAAARVVAFATLLPLSADSSSSAKTASVLSTWMHNCEYLL